MVNPIYTRQVLGLDEYLIELDKADLDRLSVMPAIKAARKTLYTLQGSKVDIGAIYIDSLPWDWEDDGEAFFDDGEE